MCRAYTDTFAHSSFDLQILRLSRPSREDSESCISDSTPSRSTTPVSTNGRQSCCRSNSCHSHTSVSRPATRQSTAGIAPCTSSHYLSHSGRMGLEQCTNNIATHNCLLQYAQQLLLLLLIHIIHPSSILYVRRSSDGAPPATKVLSFKSQRDATEQGASFPHMSLLQRIVSEQWYPFECKQRVPTAKSVLKTLSECTHALICLMHTLVLLIIICTYRYVLRVQYIWWVHKQGI